MVFLNMFLSCYKVLHSFTVQDHVFCKFTIFPSCLNFFLLFCLFLALAEAEMDENTYCMHSCHRFFTDLSLSLLPCSSSPKSVKKSACYDSNKCIIKVFPSSLYGLLSFSSVWLLNTDIHPQSDSCTHPHTHVQILHIPLLVAGLAPVSHSLSSPGN